MNTAQINLMVQNYKYSPLENKKGLQLSKYYLHVWAKDVLPIHVVTKMQTLSINTASSRYN